MEAYCSACGRAHVDARDVALLRAMNNRKKTVQSHSVLRTLSIAFAAVMLSAVLPAAADDEEAELAKKTLNPVASLISLPMKYDYNSDLGPAQSGNQSVLTVQPVIPVSIGEDWNLISRTIIPVISLHNIVPGAGTQQGLGDTTAQFYFSPKKPTDAGWIWGVGPQFLLPTGAGVFTASRWGVGPTAVVLKQESGWTYGALVNQMWSFSDDSQKSAYSSLYVQPFLAFTTKTYTTAGINTESTYNWQASKWSVPVNLTLTQILKVGKQPLSLQVGTRYWADTPDGVGPKGWGYRFQLTLLFPK
jgi:hypothetical protein